MGKYEPLARFLKQKSALHVSMTFKDVEKVIAGRLPASAYDHRAWWANEAAGHAHAKAWLEAGYETEQVDMAARKLVFRRLARRGMADGARDYDSAENAMEKKPRRSPLFGALKGTFTIEPGYDVTSPMYSDEEWAEIETNVQQTADLIEEGLSGKRK